MTDWDEISIYSGAFFPRVNSSQQWETSPFDMKDGRPQYFRKVLIDSVVRVIDWFVNVMMIYKPISEWDTIKVTSEMNTASACSKKKTTVFSSRNIKVGTNHISGRGIQKRTPRKFESPEVACDAGQSLEIQNCRHNCYWFLINGGASDETVSQGAFTTTIIFRTKITQFFGIITNVGLCL